MGFSSHPYYFQRIGEEGEEGAEGAEGEEGAEGAEIRINQTQQIEVYIGDKYRELYPKPGKAPRTLTVTNISPPSNDNSGAALVSGSTERGWWSERDSARIKSSTSIMAYTLHSHWEKVEA